MFPFQPLLQPLKNYHLWQNYWGGGALAPLATSAPRYLKTLILFFLFSEHVDQLLLQMYKVAVTSQADINTDLKDIIKNFNCDYDCCNA